MKRSIIDIRDDDSLVDIAFSIVAALFVLLTGAMILGLLLGVAAYGLHEIIEAAL